MNVMLNRSIITFHLHPTFLTVSSMTTFEYEKSITTKSRVIFPGKLEFYSYISNDFISEADSENGVQEQTFSHCQNLYL